MNRFTVKWSKTAQDQLADAWINHRVHAKSITKAQAVMDGILANDPVGQGEDVAEGLRKITVTPITAFYAVDQAARVVRVYAVAFAP
jgi:hypothetical protein